MPASVSSWTRAAYEDLDAADEPAELEEDAEPLIEEEEDPSGWSVSQSASGRLYFWHRISRRSVWHLPPGASARKKKGRRKRKKRKRRTPRTSSRSLCARARRRQRQWHVSCFPGDVSPRAVFPSVVVWPEMPCIMAGMTRRTRLQLIGFSLRPLVSGSYLFAVLLGSTVDTCYVSLQRLLWEIAENVPFSAQCLVRQWLWEMTSWKWSFSAQCLV